MLAVLTRDDSVAICSNNCESECTWTSGAACVIRAQDQKQRNPSLSTDYVFYDNATNAA